MGRRAPSKLAASRAVGWTGAGSRPLTTWPPQRAPSCPGRKQGPQNLCPILAAVIWQHPPGCRWPGQGQGASSVQPFLWKVPRWRWNRFPSLCVAQGASEGRNHTVICTGKVWCKELLAGMMGNWQIRASWRRQEQLVEAAVSLAGQAGAPPRVNSRPHQRGCGHGSPEAGKSAQVPRQRDWLGIHLCWGKLPEKGSSPISEPTSCRGRAGEAPGWQLSWETAWEKEAEGHPSVRSVGKSCREGVSGTRGPSCLICWLCCAPQGQGCHGACVCPLSGCQEAVQAEVPSQQH